MTPATPEIRTPPFGFPAVKLPYGVGDFRFLRSLHAGADFGSLVSIPHADRDVERAAAGYRRSGGHRR